MSSISKSSNRVALSSSRFLGISLGGAKSDRTSLTVVDFYREQHKAFVIDIHTGIGSENGHTGDQVLLELVSKLRPGLKAIAFDAPLTLPPCLAGCDSSCTGYEKCKRPAVKWMRKQYSKALEKQPRLKHCTPYTQRPVDVYFRYKHLDYEIFQDETLGANLAPQAARMSYLKRHLKPTELLEVWPKLTLFHLAKAFKLSRADLMAYRSVEQGVEIREGVLDVLAKKWHLFIYDGDHKRFVRDIPAFDSLICAWVALQWDLNKVVKFKSDLPLDSGWIQLPETPEI